tara:strand:+ start:87 stop:452 length:366 start_codon:yes stop_codon:yes gene_type:complete
VLVVVPVEWQWQLIILLQRHPEVIQLLLVLVDKHRKLILILPMQTIRQNPDHLQYLQTHQVHKQLLVLVVVLVELEGQVVVTLQPDKLELMEDQAVEVAQAPDHHQVEKELNPHKTPEYQT